MCTSTTVRFLSNWRLRRLGTRSMNLTAPGAWARTDQPAALAMRAASSTCTPSTSGTCRGTTPRPSGCTGYDSHCSSRSHLCRLAGIAPVLPTAPPRRERERRRVAQSRSHPRYRGGELAPVGADRPLADVLGSGSRSTRPCRAGGRWEPSRSRGAYRSRPSGDCPLDLRIEEHAHEYCCLRPLMLFGVQPAEMGTTR